jgi:hypothetical protein
MMNNGRKSRKQPSHHHINNNHNSTRLQQSGQSMNVGSTEVLSKKYVSLQRQKQLIRYGCTVIALLVTYYIILSIHMMLFHSVTDTSIFAKQSTTPLRLTNSEQDLISRIFGIKKPTSPTIHLWDRCTIQNYKIQVPPTTLRKGKSQNIADIDYQNQAVNLVHNIRVLLGTATQLGSTQQQQRRQLDTNPTVGEEDPEAVSSIDANTSSTIITTATTEQSVSWYKSLDNAVIMDYGCGPGRFLIGLLSANVCFHKYIGVDVNINDIQWLTETYMNSNKYSKFVVSGTQKLNLNKKRTIMEMNNKVSSLYDHIEQQLEFIHVNVRNERYNKEGQVLDTESIEKYKRIIFKPEVNDALVNTVDVMILRSVFTHMLAADIYHHLHALYPSLKRKTGIMVVSLFLNTIPESPVETVMSREEQQRGMHLVYISKTVFENILYETGYHILLYMSRWNMGEDVYVLSTDGKYVELEEHESNDEVNVEQAGLEK